MIFKPSLISLLILFSSNFIFLFSGNSFSQTTLSDYAAFPTTNFISISPSGNRLAVRIEAQGQDILKVVDLTTGKMINGLDLGAIDPQNIYFFDEDRLILKVYEEKELGYTDLNEVSSAFVFNLRDNELHQLLVPGDFIYKGQSGVGNIVGISKDGNIAYMPAFIQKGKTQTFEYSLMEVDLTQVSHPKVKKRAGIRAIDYFMDGAGKILAIAYFDARYNKYWIDSFTGNDAKTIYETTEPVRPFNIQGVTPDRKSLVLKNYSESSDRAVCYTMSLSDGSISKELFGRDDADIGWFLTDINRVVYGVTYTGFHPRYEFFDTTLTKRLREIQQLFPSESVWLTSHSDDWKHIVVQVDGTTTAGTYYLFSENQKTRLIAKGLPQFNASNIQTVIESSYQAQDGLSIPTLLTIPKKYTDKPQHMPTVILPHGGPEAHDWFGFNWLAQAIANEGYLVIQPQFRGSTGFGYQHRMAGHGEWGKKMQSDLSDAITAFSNKGLVDKNNVCIVGWSYGGYAALAGGAFDGDTYKCVVSVNGVTDIYSMMKEEKEAKSRWGDVYKYWESVIGDGELDKAFMQSISPYQFAGQFTQPALLIYSDEDEVVPPKQSKIMYKALKKAGKSVQQVKIKGEGHSFIDITNREKTLKAITDFLKLYLH